MLLTSFNQSKWKGVEWTAVWNGERGSADILLLNDTQTHTHTPTINRLCVEEKRDNNWYFAGCRTDTPTKMLIYGCGCAMQCSTLNAKSNALRIAEYVINSIQIATFSSVFDKFHFENMLRELYTWFLYSVHTIESRRTLTPIRPARGGVRRRMRRTERCDAK